LNKSINYLSEKEYFVKEKKHHLDASFYKGNHCIAVTLCIQERKPIFTSENIFEAFESRLLKSLEKHTSDALAYLFMPDHCHLLVQGKNRNSDLKKMILLFKQLTGFWLSKNMPGTFWQKDYYDHILRKAEDVNKHIGYIFLNPVRKQIVNNWQSYPFKGSTVYNIENWVHDRSDFFS
jgi:putative transposase